MDQTSGQERQTSTPLEALWTFLAALAALGDEQEQARLTATGMPSLLSCHLSGVALHQGKDAGWQLVLQQDGRLLSRSDTASFLSELDALYAAAITEGAMLIAHGESIPQSFPLPPALVSLEAQCLAVVPLRTLHSQGGMLLVGRKDRDGFTRQEGFILRTLAAHSAMAIENRRLQHTLQKNAVNLERVVEARTAQLRRAEERQRVLLDINNAIIANLERTSLFRAIIGALRTILRFDRASLALYDPGRDVLTISALEGSATPQWLIPVGAELPRQGSHLGWVIDHRRPLICGDLPQKRARSPEEDRLLREGLRAYVAVPLLAKNTIIGTLNVASRTPDQYTEEDATFLLEVAYQVALAVENMVAYEEIAQLKARLEQESVYLQEEIKTQHNFEEIIGQSPALRKVLQTVETVAPTDASVLILGETGTGKELIARAVHHLSPRSGRALVKVNCAALPASLIESELFGHEKGAFTGALTRKIGRFELADGGTIFLDEIGDIPPEMQVKLLRVLQEQEFERVGGTQTIKVDVRVISATNRDLKKAVEEDTYRADLYYRLSVFPLSIPPLRERPEDIELLVRYFVSKYMNKMGKRITEIAHQTMQRLTAYSWPGNIRELEHLIERGVILSKGSTLEIADEFLPASPMPQGDQAEPQTLEEVERNHIVKTLERTHWVIDGPYGAAKILSLHPNTLRGRMRKLHITRPHHIS